MNDRETKSLEQRLLGWFAPWRSCAVALSGGVDSAVVAAAAYRVLGSRALALTATSPSVPQSERRTARQVAALIGIRHYVLDTDELSNPLYTRNAPDRCFHCKSELYTQMQKWLVQEPVDVIVNGTNADDLHDYRPGLQAGLLYQVRSPLAECGLHKDDVRQLARHWKLPIWDKPAAPCLASRIAYGEEVTAERLAMIENAEAFLKNKGFSVVRVRLHADHLARIELLPKDMPRLLADDLRTELLTVFRQLGFTYVTVDLAGYRSGSLNEALPLVALQLPVGS